MAITINGTTGIAGVDGSASTPAVQGTDTNTGIFFPAADTIAFTEGGTESMRIDSDGNVGIGATSLSNKLTVNGNQVLLANGSIKFADGGNAQVSFIKNSAASNLSQMEFYTDSTERARFTSDGYFKASTTGSYFSQTGNQFLTDTDSNVLFLRNTSASMTNAVVQFDTERNTTNGTYNIMLYYNRAAAEVRFKVLDSGNVQNINNSYAGTSDIKLKQDIVDAGSQWNDIKNLQVRKYRWKSNPDGFMQLGLVAQEAELISPGLIDEHPDYEEVEVTDADGNVTIEKQATGTTTKAIKYSVLYMKAVKALQEAMERIETLEAQNAAFEARLAALEAK